MTAKLMADSLRALVGEQEEMWRILAAIEMLHLRTDNKVLFVVNEDGADGVYDFYSDEVPDEAYDLDCKILNITDKYEDGEASKDTIFVTIQII